MKHAQVLLASSSVEKGRGLSLEGSTGEPSPGALYTPHPQVVPSRRDRKGHPPVLGLLG